VVKMKANEILNDMAIIKNLDSSDMIDDINDMPASIENAIKISKKLNIPDTIKNEILDISYQRPENIIIVGMGGSAIGGDLLKDFLFSELNIPLETIRGYDIPKYVSNKTLVIVVSYSGNTEETLSCFTKGLERNAMVICISSNGLLEKICSKQNIPIILVPKNIQPRASIPYLFFPLLIIMNLMGISSDYKKEIEETVSILIKLTKKIGLDVPFEQNAAKQFAEKLHGKVTLIFAPPRYGAVANRMKCQINENSKQLAYWNVFPELNHNEIVGWEKKLDVLKHFCLILIRCNNESVPIKTRVDLTIDLIFKDKIKTIIEMKSEIKSLLAQFFSLIFIGDMISYYLAILNEVDPSPVKDISILKKQLKSRYNLTADIEQRYL